MKKNSHIQFKAAFLLLVFAMNMAIGFACAVGADMLLNSTHHQIKDIVKVHTHANGDKHEHHTKFHQHNWKEKNTENKEKKGCCNDSVLKIAQTEKTLPQFNNIANPVFFTSLIASYYNFNTFYASQLSEKLRYFLQNYHPPITDIRIAIQRFQI